MTGTKQCSRCGQTKDVAEFHRRASTGRLEAACRACERERVLAYRAAQRAAVGDETYRTDAAEAQQARRQANGYGYERARERARAALREQYRDEFEEIRRGLTGPGTHDGAETLLAAAHRAEFDELLAKERKAHA